MGLFICWRLVDGNSSSRAGITSWSVSFVGSLVGNCKSMKSEHMTAESLRIDE